MHCKPRCCVQKNELEIGAPYVIDPNRTYSLVYLDGRLIGGTSKPAGLGLKYVKEKENSYWFQDVNTVVVVAKKDVRRIWGGGGAGN